MTVIGLAVVVSAALWVRASPAPLRIGPWLATLVGALAAAVRKGPLTGPGLALAVTGVFALWRMTIQPSNDRDRQSELPRLLTAEVDPDDPSRVVSRNVRNFGPAPADRGEAFSSMADFFKNDELILTGSDERDAVQLRTSLQTGNRVVLHRVTGRPEMMRELLVEYLDLANELAERPRVYRTILDHCTAVVWKLADHLVPGLPIDPRVVLSGYLPESLHDRGTLGARHSLEELTPGASCRRTSPATAPARASPPRSGPGSLRPEPGPCRSFRSGAQGRS